MRKNKSLNRIMQDMKKFPAQRKQKDIIYTPDGRGQWDYPGFPTRIPGNNITMQGVPYPIKARTSTGHEDILYPGQVYNFPHDVEYVDEFPLYQLQKGGVLPQYQTRGQVGSFKPWEIKLKPQIKLTDEQKQNLDRHFQSYHPKNRYGQYWDNKIKEQEQQKKAEEERQIQERKNAAATRKKVIAGDKNATFTFPDGKTKAWKDMDWREQSYVSGKNLGSFNNNNWTDYVNPLAMLGSMGEGLATSPYVARETNSIVPYLTGVGAPLLTGALAGAGAKTTGQFINNLVNPLAGLGSKPVVSSSVDDVGRGFKSEIITPEGFQNRVFDSNVQLGSFQGKGHLSEKGFNYRTLSEKELEAIQKSKGVFPKEGKAKGGNENVKYWTKGNEKNWYADNPNQQVIRVKENKFTNDKVVDANDVEFFNHSTGKFESINNYRPFKSEIDWAKWNKEIPENKALMQEYNAIEQQTKANDTWMKNPDGSAFKGTPEQFVQQNSKNFKKAFGDSKLVNPDGSPTIQYHGSAKKFDTFDESKFQLGDAGYSGQGIYTTPSKTTANSYATSSAKFHSGEIEPTVYELYGQANNPISSSQLIKEGKERDLFNFHRKRNWKGELTPEESLMEYDAAIADQLPNVQNIRPWYDAREIVFPTNKQLKSAVGNNGMFDMTNPNIYKSVLPYAVPVGLGAGALQQKKKGGQTTLDKFYKNLFQNVNKRIDESEDASFGKRALGTIETVVEDPLNALKFLFTKKQKLSNPWENPYGVDFISDRQGDIKKTWAPKYGTVDISTTTLTTTKPPTNNKIYYDQDGKRIPQGWVPLTPEYAKGRYSGDLRGMYYNPKGDNGSSAISYFGVPKVKSNNNIPEKKLPQLKMVDVEGSTSFILPPTPVIKNFESPQIKRNYSGMNRMVEYYDPTVEGGVQGGWHRRLFPNIETADLFMKQQKMYGPSMTNRAILDESDRREFEIGGQLQQFKPGGFATTLVTTLPPYLQNRDRGYGNRGDIQGRGMPANVKGALQPQIREEQVISNIQKQTGVSRPIAQQIRQQQTQRKSNVTVGQDRRTDYERKGAQEKVDDVNKYREEVLGIPRGTTQRDLDEANEYKERLGNILNVGLTAAPLLEGALSLGARAIPMAGRNASRLVAPTSTSVRQATIEAFNPKTKMYETRLVDIPEQIIPGRSFEDVQHKIPSLLKDLNIGRTEHWLRKNVKGFGKPIPMNNDQGLVIDQAGKIWDKNTRYWLNRQYGHTPNPLDLIKPYQSQYSRSFGTLISESPKPNLTSGSFNFVGKSGIQGQPLQSRSLNASDISIVHNPTRSDQLAGVAYDVMRGKSRVGELMGSWNPDKNFISQSVEILPEFQGMGIGTKAYEQLARSLPEGSKVVSSGMFNTNQLGSQPGKNLWESLVRSGKAVKLGEGNYKMLKKGGLILKDYYKKRLTNRRIY